jgi:putative RNA 2'-phosphotransferase
MTKKHQRTSRFLSLVLRHDPAVIGLQLDPQGWASVDDLLAALKDHRKPLTLSELKSIVSGNNKRRFHFSEDGTRIRAAQGHSIEVDLQFNEQTPPDLLFHGTATRFMNLIEREGINKMSRQHVHLSADIRTAHSSGRRHEKSVILEVAAALMQTHGFKFFLSQNGVWLTESVPPDYLARRFSI